MTPIPDWARASAERMWRAALLSPDPVGTIAEILMQDRPPLHGEPTVRKTAERPR